MTDVFGTVYPVQSSLLEVLKSDSSDLNQFLNGGLIYGGITEIYGDTESGRTLLAINFLKKSLELGLSCLYIDTCDNLDLDKYKCENLYYTTVIDDDLLRALTFSDFDLIIVDDINSFFCKDSTCTDKNYYLNELNTLLFSSKKVVLLINQVRNIHNGVGWEKVPLGGKGFASRCLTRIKTKFVRKTLDSVTLDLEILKSPLMINKKSRIDFNIK